MQYTAFPILVQHEGQQFTVIICVSEHYDDLMNDMKQHFGFDSDPRFCVVWDKRPNGTTKLGITQSSLRAALGLAKERGALDCRLVVFEKCLGGGKEPGGESALWVSSPWVGRVDKHVRRAVFDSGLCLIFVECPFHVRRIMHRPIVDSANAGYKRTHGTIDL